jgi:glucosamine-phosphate N-acetyltransferase
MDIDIRLLRKEDLDQGFMETLAENWKVDDASKNAFDQITRGDNYNFVAVHNQQVIGHVCLHYMHKFFWSGSIVGLIEDVIVRKAYRDQGVAAKLIEAAINKAKEIGCYRVSLTCSDNLMPFYQKFGFSSDERSMKLLLKHDNKAGGL